MSLHFHFVNREVARLCHPFPFSSSTLAPDSLQQPIGPHTISIVKYLHLALAAQQRDHALTSRLRLLLLSLYVRTHLQIRERGE